MTLPKDIRGRDPILNADGTLVAMRYLRQQQMIVECGPGKARRQHVFSMKANISMGWIPLEDVPCCLAVKGGCCGQRKAGIIIYANEADVRQWTNGGGR